MSTAAISRKRPCRVCRRWFRAHPRLKDRQKTCGAEACKKEWHRRQCEQWNHNNTAYFNTTYLRRKLGQFEVKRAAEKGKKGQKGSAGSRLRTGMPLEYVQEVISLEHAVIIEYSTQLLWVRFQDAIRAQVAEINKRIGQQGHVSCLRSDGHGP